MSPWPWPESRSSLVSVPQTGGQGLVGGVRLRSRISPSANAKRTRAMTL